MAGKSKPATKPARRYRQFTDRRLEILRSAADAFTRSDFTRATMGEIADQVQMAKGNLYYYFPSKQELLFFCQDESLGRLVDRATTISRPKDSADEQLRAMIAFHIKTILEELPGSTVIELGIRQGIFRKCDVKTAAWAILGALNWSVQWFSPKGEITVAQLGQNFGDLFVHSLRR